MSAPVPSVTRVLPRSVRAVFRKCVLGVLPVVGVVMVCSSALHTAPAYAGGATITGTGSSYAAVAINQWVAQVASLYGDNVNYATSASVTGLNEFALQQVDFGASEIGYSTGQANNEPKAGYSYQYLPDVAGAECLDYNLQSTTGQQVTNLNLNSDAMTKIFTGQISTWSNPEIAALNPSIQLPNTPIVVAYRTDASGDNYLFSNYLDTIQPSLWNAFTQALSSPPGAQAIWPTPPSGARSVGPYSFGNWNGENGSDNASNYVYGNVNSITYVETSYALLHHDPCASVENASGAFVKPSRDADATALLSDQLEPDLEQLLTGVYLSPQATAYPISAYSYLLTGVNTPGGAQEVPSDKASVMGQFIQFIACQGQQSAGQLGYSPLPPNLVQADFNAVTRITGVTLPAPTAQNCANPYIDGSIPLAGEPIIGSAPQAGGSSGAVAAGPVATSTTSASAAAAAAASHGGGGTVGAASGGNGASSSSSQSASSSAGTGKALSAGRSGKKTTATGPVLAPAPGQKIGANLELTATKLLGIPGPTNTIALASTVFFAVLITPPLLAYLFRRKSRTAQHGPEEEVIP